MPVTSGSFGAAGISSTTPEVNTAISTVGAGTLTAAGIAGGLITRTGPTAAYTDTTDTAAAIIAAMPNAAVNQSWELTIKNMVAFAETIAAGVGVTLTGQTIIPPNMAGRFLVTYTGAGAVSILGLGEIPLTGALLEASSTLTTAGAGTILASTIAGAEVTRTGPTGAFTDTTDTATAIIAALPNANIGQAWEFTYVNNTAFACTFAGGVGVTLTMLGSGTLTCPQNSWTRFLCVYSGAGAVTMQGIAQGPNSILLPAKFTTINVGTGTLAAGQASGAAYVDLTSTNATPGSQAMRTVAQVLLDTPGLAVGMSYVLRVKNTGAGTFTLATDASAQFTMTGTMTVLTNSFRDFLVTINTATTGTVQDIGSPLDLTTLAGTLTLTAGEVINSATAAAITAARTLTSADSGGIFSVAKTSAYAITLPTPAQGLKFKFMVLDTGANAVTITDSSAHLRGVVDVAGVPTIMTGTTLSLVSGGGIGDWVEFEGIDATHYLVTGMCVTAAKITMA